MFYYTAVWEQINTTHSLCKDAAAMDSVMKGVLVSAMFNAHTQCSGMKEGLVSVAPSPIVKRNVVANKMVKVGELELFCFATTVMKLVGEKKKLDFYGEVSYGNFKNTYSIRGIFADTTEHTRTHAGQSVCVPFWYVKCSDERHACNLEVNVVEVKVAGFTIRFPKLVNSKKVMKGDSLVRPKFV
jgi:hypothetical protein